MTEVHTLSDTDRAQVEDEMRASLKPAVARCVALAGIVAGRRKDPNHLSCDIYDVASAALLVSLFPSQVHRGSDAPSGRGPRYGPIGS